MRAHKRETEAPSWMSKTLPLASEMQATMSSTAARRRILSETWGNSEANLVLVEPLMRVQPGWPPMAASREPSEAAPRLSSLGTVRYKCEFMVHCYTVI